MAYISGYTYDIFISYAHLDNLKMPGQQEGWIELFYKSLVLKLTQRVGKIDAVKVWWDSKKLDGSKLFDNSIEEGIRNSAIMISLISPGYLQSEYCMREMELFYNKSISEKQGISVGDNSRMIKVLLNNIPHTKLPEQFGRATGFPFYSASGAEDYGDPLNLTDPVFAQQLKDLRDALVRIFELFPKEQTSAPAPVGNESNGSSSTNAGNGPDGMNIYFAEVSDSLRSTRKRITTELQKNGYNILAGVPPPDETAAHDEKASSLLKQSDLAVHLLDQFPGREMQEATNWYPKKQLELSMPKAVSKLVWVPAELDNATVEEEAYRNFLQSLEKNTDAASKFEYIRGNKSELSRQIMEYADAIKQSRIRKESNQKISILLDTHFSDQKYAFNLGQAMLDHNIQPYINPQEDDPHKNSSLLAERISQVNKLVFLYGNVSRDWVLERMNAALQLIVVNNYPIEDFYIYLAPPHKANEDIKLNQRFLKVNVLNNSMEPGMSNEMLDTFLENMKVAAV